jgi:hypothetical protein
MQNIAFLQASGEGSDKCLMAQRKAEHRRAGYCSTGNNNKQQNRTLQCNAEQHKAFIGALKATVHLKTEKHSAAQITSLHYKSVQCISLQYSLYIRELIQVCERLIARHSKAQNDIS